MKNHFFSTLFKKNITKGDSDYDTLVIAEVLYRLKIFELRNCSCMKCQDDRKKLEEYINKKLKDVK